MKKIGILLISMLCGYVTYAQNYNEYLEAAQKHLQQGNYEKAQASYNVYVNMTGQTSDDFEKLLRNHKQNVAKQEGFIDLGLPSGTCWAQPSTSLYSYEDAKSLINNTGVTLPTPAQYRELIDNCKWRWTGTGFKVTGPNGNSLFFAANGAEFSDGSKAKKGKRGYYWTSDAYFVLGIYDSEEVLLQHYVNSSTKKRSDKLSYCLCKIFK